MSTATSVQNSRPGTGARVGHAVRRVAQTPRAFANWPSLLARLATARVRTGDLHFETRSGVQVDCPNVAGARVPVYEVFAEDCYDLAGFTADLCGQAFHALDIGGHVGSFTCQLAALHPAATVDAFEPSPTTFGYLSANVARNGLTDRVACVQAAVGAEPGSVDLFEASAGSALNAVAAAGSVSGPRTTVPMVGIAEIFAAPTAPVRLVKIDCEGAEYGIVLGSDPELWRDVDHLVLEYHAVPGHSWSELAEYFAERGLRELRHDEVAPGQGTVWLTRAA